MKINEKEFFNVLTEKLDDSFDFNNISNKINYEKYKKEPKKVFLFKKLNLTLTSLFLVIMTLTVVLLPKNNSMSTTTTTTTTVMLTSENRIYPEFYSYFNKNKISNILVVDLVEILENGMYACQDVYYALFETSINDKDNIFSPSDKNEIIIESSCRFDNINYIHIYKVLKNNNEYIKESDNTVEYNSTESSIIINFNSNEDLVGYYIQVGLIYNVSETQAFRYHTGTLILFE